MTLDELKALASPQWGAVLEGVGIPKHYLDKRHHPCPACGGRDRFRFTNYQDTGGFICNQCTPEGGSGFDLIMLVLGCDFNQAVDLVKNQLGIVANDNLKPPKTPFKRLSPKNHTKPLKDDLKRIQGYLWDAKPVTQHSPVGKYLRNRGFDWHTIHHGLRGVYYRESLDYWTADSFGRPFKLGAFPAMVAKITKGAELLGVHLTYLQNDKGAWRKAEIINSVTGKNLPAKKMQTRYPGALSGASIALYRPLDNALAVCEGIETALAVRQLFSLPVWACGSAGMLRNVELPADLKTLYIIADNDENQTGRDA